MALYQVNYNALEPVWGDVRLNAENVEDAQELAKKEIGYLYPEYIDVNIESVEDMHD